MIPSTEENISDLLELVNSQLKSKQKEIIELKNLLYKPSLRHFKQLSSEKLRELKKYYLDAGEIIEKLMSPS